MFTDTWWKTNESALDTVFMEKNKSLWKQVWKLIGARAFAAGYLRAHAKFGLPGKPPSMKDILELRFPDAKKFFDKQGLKFVKEMTETDKGRLHLSLSQSFGIGAKRFAEKFKDDYIFSNARLQNIYRTEAHISNRHAQTEGAKDAGMKTKTWYATGDESMCPICGKLNGQTVPIDKPYSNGEMVAHAHPRCRCQELYH
jgi:SPP1 gp7 family putative phage head morphogenesis protein